MIYLTAQIVNYKFTCQQAIYKQVTNLQIHSFGSFLTHTRKRGGQKGAKRLYL